MSSRRPTKPARALSFDLDETLLDGSRFAESTIGTCNDIALEFKGMNAKELLNANTRVIGEYWPEISDRWTLGSISGAAVTLEAWRRSLRACGCNDETIAERAAQIHLHRGRASYRLFDDARDLLVTALQLSLPLALITNGASDTQRDKLDALGISDAFNVIVISGEMGVAKPAAQVFDLALAQLSLNAESVWHIGDNLATDVAGAKAASRTAVWINRNGRIRRESDPLPDFDIRSLRELAGELSR